MAIAAPIAAISSIASMGLSAGSAMMGAAGTNAADQMQAAQAEQAAQFATLQAQLTDTTMRQKLNTTLANIDAIRASGNADPNSPTTNAIDKWNTQLSDTQRLAADVTERSQAASDLSSANYLHQAGQFALGQGAFSALTGISGGLAKGFAPGGAFA